MKKTTFLLIGLIVSVFSIVSCKKKDDPAPAPTTPTTTAPTSINSTRQATFKLDGTKVSYVFGNANFDMSYGAGGGIGSGGSPTTRYFDASIGNVSGVGITITKGTLVVAAGGYPSDAEFATFFPVGTVAYSPALSNPNGIEISYWDGTTQWKSNFGTADQTGSAFSIVDRKFTTMGGDYTVKTYLTFNCKLYDGSGNVKTLTDGVFIGDFANL